MRPLSCCELLCASMGDSSLLQDQRLRFAQTKKIFMYLSFFKNQIVQGVIIDKGVVNIGLGNIRKPNWHNFNFTVKA